MKSIRNWFGVMVLGAVCVAQAGDGWQVQVGGVYQWGMKMNTRGPALTTEHNGQYRIPPGGLVGASGPDDPDNQTFVDGYVRRDWLMDSTDPIYQDPINQSMTWNWSYSDKDKQFNEGDQTLAFHRQTAETSTSSGQDEFNATGVDLSARRDLWSCYGLDVGVKLDLAWFPSAKASQMRSTALAFDTFYFSDNYAVIGVVRDLGSSYQGPDYDNYEIAVPLPLNYTPVRITDTIEQTTVSTKVDLERVRGGIGPTLQVSLTDNLRLYATPQLTLSMARATVKRTQTETTTTTTTLGTGGTTTTVVSNELSEDKTAFLAGVLLAAGIDYTFTPNWFVGAYIGHEWVPSAMNISVGPDTTSLDLSGGEVSCYVGMTF